MGRHPSRPRDRRPSPASARAASALGGRSASVRGHRRAGRARSPGDDAAGLNPSTVPLTGGGPLLRHLTDRPGSHGRPRQEAPSMPWPSTNRGHRGPATPMGHRKRQHREAGPQGVRSRPNHRVPAGRRHGSSPDRWVRHDPPRRHLRRGPISRLRARRNLLTIRQGSVNLGESVRTAMRITIEYGKVKSVWDQFSNHSDKDFGPISSLSVASAAR
jgi:hypothetical protein